jgi:hypothetical protein
MLISQRLFIVKKLKEPIDLVVLNYTLAIFHRRQLPKKDMLEA